MDKQFLPAANLARGGLNTDLQPWDLDVSFVTHLSNVRIANQQLQPMGGYKVWIDLPLDSIPGFIIHVGSTSSNAWLVCGRNNVYALGGNDTFADVTSAAGYAGIGDETLWHGDMLGPVAVVNNEQHFPEYWPEPSLGQILLPLPWDAGNSWSDVGEQCRIIRAHKQFLFALGATVSGVQYEDAVRWSSPADNGGVPDTWDHLDTTAKAGLVFLGGQGGNIVDGHSLRDAFVVYRESGISIFDYIGGNLIWRIRNLSSSQGLATKNGIIETKGVHLIMGDGDILVNDGNTIKSLMHDRVRNQFIAEVNPDAYFRSYAVKNDILNEAWFCVPTKDAVYPDKAYVYNWVDNTWTTRSIPQDDTTNATVPVNPLVHCNYGSQLTEGKSWDDQAETWATIKRRWSAAQVSPLKDVIVGATRTGDIITNFTLVESVSDPFVFPTDTVFADPIGMHFKSDGTKFYTCSQLGNEVAEFDVGTPFVLSTATLVQKFSFSTENGSELTGITMSADGTKMWIASRSSAHITQYTLGTAYDVSTITYDSIEINEPNAMVAEPGDIHIAQAGKLLFVSGRTASSPKNAAVERITLPTANTVVGAFATANTIQNGDASLDSDAIGMTMNDDGTILYATFFTDGEFVGAYQTQLLIPYDLKTAQPVITAGSFAYSITSIYWDDINDLLVTLRQYGILAGDIRTAQAAQTANWTNHRASGILISTDGLTVWNGNTNDSHIRQYTLGTAWDATSIGPDIDHGKPNTPTLSFSDVGGIFWKPDGTTFFTNCQGPAASYAVHVLRNPLTTPWDLSLISTTDIADQEVDFSSDLSGIIAQGNLWFSDDGTTMLMNGITDVTLYQWTLSSAWDLTTATLDGTFDLSTDCPGAISFSISPDGLSLYAINNPGTSIGDDDCVQWTLGNPWDVVTTTPVLFGSKGLGLASSSLNGMCWKPDATKIFFADSGSFDRIISYDVGLVLGNGGGSGPPADAAAQSQTIVTETVTPEDAGKLVYVDGGIRGGENFVAFDTMIERVGFPLNGLGRVSSITRVYPHIVSVDDSDQDDADQLKIFIQLGSQDFPGASIRWKAPVRFRPYADRKVDVITTGELHCYRIYSENTNKDWAVSGMDFEWIDGGKR